MGGVFLELLRDCAISFFPLTLALSRGEREEDQGIWDKGEGNGSSFSVIPA